MTAQFQPFPADRQERLAQARTGKQTLAVQAAGGAAAVASQQRSLPSVQPMAQPDMSSAMPQVTQAPSVQTPVVAASAPMSPEHGIPQQHFQAQQPVHVPQRFDAPQQTPIATASASIANPMPGQINPVADGEGISLALPSHFAFYGFKDLYVRPFKNRNLAKLARAHAEQSLLPVVEAVSSVLSTSSGSNGALGFQLTINDFYFVLYWLRLNSFTKSNYIHTTVCKDEKHRHDVEKGLKTPESLKIQEIVRNSTLKVNELDQIPDPEVFNVVYDGQVYPLRPATMRDTIDFTEHPQFKDPEFQYLASMACFIGGPNGEYLPLDMRVQLMDELSPDDAQLVKQYEGLMSHYGVEETIQVKCKGCGASQVTKLTLDAHSFLSFS